LLFLGTEFGLFVSLDAGQNWTRFTAGVPTVSVMDMAIQRRENDLVLGTHGRSIYVLDDYSALRGLSESDFRARLKILSTTPGQKYRAQQTPSTRFAGSGEFRAENEPYGVLVTFMASGTDLPHPDADIERERSINRRAAAAPVDDDKDSTTEDAIPKVEMRVRNESGELIRTRRFPVHQGVNRIVWEMKHDGVRPMPGPEPRDLEDGLPGGPEILSGEYEITLHLDSGETGPTDSSARVTVLADPRSHVTVEEQRNAFGTQLALLEMQETAVSAVERIVNARADVDTVLKLIGTQVGVKENKSLKALGEQAIEVNKGLDELEKRFRAPPKTRGMPYNDNRISNMIGMAQSYAGSSDGAPTATAEIYMDLARQALDQGLEALNRFMSDDLAAFSTAVDEVGIGLFRTAAPFDSGSH